MKWTLIALPLLLSQPVLAQVTAPTVQLENQKLQPASVTAFSGLGISVACSSAQVFVGASISSQLVLPGAVYGYQPVASGWQETWALAGPAPLGGDGFGYAIDMDGGRLAVGDRFAANGLTAPGSVHVFDLVGDIWVGGAAIFPTDGATADRFGEAVALGGDRLIAGARSHVLPGAAPIRGAAYVFRKEGPIWVEEAKLVSSLSTAWQFFGHSTALENDLAAVGNLTGSVHLFRRSGLVWTLEAIVPAVPFLFGISAVVLEAGVLYIGYAADSEQGLDAGAVYVFELQSGAWQQTDKIMATGGGPGRQFGSDLDLDGDSLIIGAAYGDGVVADSGVAHLFSRASGAWTEISVLMGSDSQFEDGAAMVAISGTTAVLGAPFHDAMGQSAGAAYVFHIGDADFRRGDTNDDGNVDIADAIATLSALFIPGSGMPSCADAADANDDGAMNIADPIATLSSLFGGGAPLPAPGSACGADPTSDGLLCLAQGACP